MKPRSGLPAVTAALAAIVVALTFAPAALAEAGKFEASSYPAAVSGSQGAENVFKAAGGVVSCTEITYSGELTTASSTLQLVPTYAGCTAFGFVGATVTTNGCEFNIHLGTEAEGAYAASTDIVCPEGKEITIDAGPCTVHIPPQTGLGPARVEGEADLYSLGLELIGIEGNLTKNNFLCFFTPGEFSDGTYEGEVGLSTLAGFTADEYPAAISGSQTTAHELEGSGGYVSCNNVSFTASLGSASTTLSLLPFYSECTAYGFVGATVTTNGCEYRFHLEGEEGGAHLASMDIVCPEGKEITVDAGPCTVHIPPQAGLGPVTLENEAGGISIETELTGIEGNLTKNNFLCFFTPGPFNDGTYEGETLLEGSGPEPPGIDIGVTAHETPGPGAITADSYPGTVQGEQSVAHEWSFAGATISCGTAAFAGTIVEAAATFSLTPVYEGCPFYGFVNVSWTMNGCTYLFHLGEGKGGAYAGSTDIVCPVGKEITADAGPCTVHIPAQTGLGTIGFENEAGGIAIRTELTGIKGALTKNNFQCPFAAGAFSNGTYSGETVLTGKNSSGEPQTTDLGPL